MSSLESIRMERSPSTTVESKKKSKTKKHSKTLTNTQREEWENQNYFGKQEADLKNEQPKQDSLKVLHSENSPSISHQTSGANRIKPENDKWKLVGDDQKQKTQSELLIQYNDFQQTQEQNINDEPHTERQLDPIAIPNHSHHPTKAVFNKIPASKQMSFVPSYVQNRARRELGSKPEKTPNKPKLVTQTPKPIEATVVTADGKSIPPIHQIQKIKHKSRPVSVKHTPINHYKHAYSAPIEVLKQQQQQQYSKKTTHPTTLSTNLSARTIYNENHRNHDIENNDGNIPWETGKYTKTKNRLPRYRVVNYSKKSDDEDERGKKTGKKELERTQEITFFQRNAVPICIILFLSAILIALLLWDVITSTSTSTSTP